MQVAHFRTAAKLVPLMVVLFVAFACSAQSGYSKYGRTNAFNREVLFFQDDQFIESVGVAPLSVPRIVVRLPRPIDTVSGIVLNGDQLFWSTLSPRGAITRATLNGRQARQFIKNVSFVRALVSTKGFLYWLDQKEIGRAALNGSSIQRRFRKLPTDASGAAGDGLATDGRFLYVSSCQRGSIARISLSGFDVTLSFIKLGGHSCPQSLAVGGGHLYWTELGERGGTIGRADLNGTKINERWFRLPVENGPFDLAADNKAVFWTWGGPAGFIGRTSFDRSKVTPRFVRGDNSPALAECNPSGCSNA
jgi:hypothetical protein